MLRPAKLADCQQIADIYNYYVDETCITFSTEHTPEDFYASMITEDRYPILVDADGERINGFIYTHPVRTRGAYRWDVELTVYMRHGSEGHGVGREMMNACIALLRRQGFKNAYSCITLPNDRSVGMHRTLGFEDCGVWKKTGYKHGAWHDVIWMCLPLGDFEEPPQETKALKELRQ